MRNEDIQVSVPDRFLQGGTVLFVARPYDLSPEALEEVRQRVHEVHYRFLYLPELDTNFSFWDVLDYMFPGHEHFSLEEVYHRIWAIAGLDKASGFLYRANGVAYFHPLSEDLDGMIGNLRSSAESAASIRFSRSVADAGWVASIEKTEDEDLDPRAQKILLAWDEMSRKYGISLHDLDVMLDYRVKPSRMAISATGRITLPDWSEAPEVAMDDLTKALYLFFLKHPEGVSLKDMPEHGQEVMNLYLEITGRDDMEAIRESVARLVDPFGNNINISLSRIKKAFRDIVGDRVAKFYYVDGKRGEPRSIRLDRSLVDWER